MRNVFRINILFVIRLANKGKSVLKLFFVTAKLVQFTQRHR